VSIKWVRGRIGGLGNMLGVDERTPSRRDRFSMLGGDVVGRYGFGRKYINMGGKERSGG